MNLNREPMPVDDALFHAPSTSGQLIAVVGAVGGAGATTVALNVGSELQELGPSCVVDLCSARGDVAGVLSTWPKHTLREVFDAGDRLDEALLKGSAVTTPGGLSLLGQPYELGDVVQADANEARRLFSVARKTYEHVVVDCGIVIDPAVITCLEQADLVLLVCSPDVNGMRGGRRMLNLFDALDVPRDRVKLVVNKYSVFRGFAASEIESRVGVQVFALLPRASRLCDRLDVDGGTLREVAPRARLRRRTQELAQQVADATGGAS